MNRNLLNLALLCLALALLLSLGLCASPKASTDPRACLTLPKLQDCRACCVDAGGSKKACQKLCSKPKTVSPSEP